MKMFDIDWKELFFPVLEDIKNINKETDTTTVSSNNWALAQDNSAYNAVLDKIKENREKDESQHNIVVI